MPTRGSVNYTLPAFNAGATKVTVADLQYLCNTVMLTNDREFYGLEAVWNNPDRITNGLPLAVRQPAGDATFAAIAGQAANSLQTGNNIKASELSSIAACLNTLAAKYRTRFNGPAAVTGVSVGDSLTAAKLQELTGSLNIISGNLDGMNSWWNGDTCNRSCQIACQAACQNACQYCYGGQGHGQNCGGWS